MNENDENLQESSSKSISNTKKKIETLYTFNRKRKEPPKTFTRPKTRGKRVNYSQYF